MQPYPTEPKRPSRLFVSFERAILGLGMGVVAFFIERRLLKAIKQGSVEPAMRTAGEAEPDAPPSLLSAATNQVEYKAER
jgi:hypothetical protein